jgi:hypothetical protein
MRKLSSETHINLLPGLLRGEDQGDLAKGKRWKPI